MIETWWGKEYSKQDYKGHQPEIPPDDRGIKK